MEQVPWNIREADYETVQLRTAGAGGGGGGIPMMIGETLIEEEPLQEILHIKGDQEGMDLMMMTLKMK